MKPFLIILISASLIISCSSNSKTSSSADSDAAECAEAKKEASDLINKIKTSAPSKSQCKIDSDCVLDHFNHLDMDHCLTTTAVSKAYSEYVESKTSEVFGAGAKLNALCGLDKDKCPEDSTEGYVEAGCKNKVCVLVIVE